MIRIQSNHIAIARDATASYRRAARSQKVCEKDSRETTHGCNDHEDEASISFDKVSVRTCDRDALDGANDAHLFF